MTEQEQREVATRLSEDSDIFDFERAMELVRYRPAEAKTIIRDREKMERIQEEQARARKRMLQALREEFG